MKDYERRTDFGKPAKPQNVWLLMLREAFEATGRVVTNALEGSGGDNYISLLVTYCRSSQKQPEAARSSQKQPRRPAT